jgi:hypothetical protein
MIEKIPYIIVDNRKILPIKRMAHTHPANGDRRGRREQPFGVVDRVTLSAEGREKSRNQTTHPHIASASAQVPLKKRQPAAAALLTYSPYRMNPDAL